jgi:hypothetical protein
MQILSRYKQMVQFQKKTLCIQTASRRKLCCNEPLNDKVIAGDTWLGARPVSGGDVYNVEQAVMS